MSGGADIIETVSSLSDTQKWGSPLTKPLMHQIWLLNPVEKHLFHRLGVEVTQRGLPSFSLQCLRRLSLQPKHAGALFSGLSQPFPDAAPPACASNKSWRCQDYLSQQQQRPPPPPHLPDLRIALRDINYRAVWLVERKEADREREEEWRIKSREKKRYTERCCYRRCHLLIMSSGDSEVMLWLYSIRFPIHHQSRWCWSSLRGLM